ncbi:hypothetical protein [Aeromicrobium sp. UC242_57]|uniref:hypothetical protein n=1 Tax=Aeromicrobium sp. UC242_57 TaxID=3374624 RepID=UPI00379373F8
MTPLLLGLIGLALALPVPAVLATMTWPRLSPAAGVVLWQSLALAAVLAISGAALSTALWLVTDDHLTWWRIALHLTILAIGVMVWARFWWAAWQAWSETSVRRRRHREARRPAGRTSRRPARGADPGRADPHRLLHPPST